MLTPSDESFEKSAIFLSTTCCQCRPDACAAAQLRILTERKKIIDNEAHFTTRAFLRSPSNYQPQSLKQISHCEKIRRPTFRALAPCQSEPKARLLIRDVLKLLQIPALFDILRYLKTAWRKKRLVMTVPWAVQYLSMMDPLGPLLDYFSEVLHWLLRTYRFVFTVIKFKNIVEGNVTLANV